MSRSAQPGQTDQTDQLDRPSTPTAPTIPTATPRQETTMSSTPTTTPQTTQTTQTTSTRQRPGSEEPATATRDAAGTATPRPDPAYRPDLKSVGRVPFHRLVVLELRKMVDTRAGRGVLIAIIALTVLSMGVTMWVMRDAGAGLLPLLLAANVPQAVLLPILGVMTAANEWSQRTALITFTQEPRRLRVMLAKALAAVVLGLGVLAVTLGLAAGGHALSVALADGGGSVDLSLTTAFLVHLVVLQLQGVLMGVAFGALLLNVPLGIVAYVLVPTLSPVIFLMTAWLREHGAWFDLVRAGEPLLGEDWLTGEQWAQFGTSTAIWVLLPLALGFWRVVRKEVK